MVKDYAFPCACGSWIDVELFQAGGRVKCQDCREIASVPTTIRLQELAGEKPITQSPTERVLTALRERKFPFDGGCVYCESPAQLRLPVRFTPLGLEQNEGPISFSIFFCDQCYQQFRKVRRPERFRYYLIELLTILMFVPALLFSIVVVIALPFVGPWSFFEFLYHRRRGRSIRSAEPFLLDQLQQIPLVGRMIDSHVEFQIRSAPVRRILRHE